MKINKVFLSLISVAVILSIGCSNITRDKSSAENKKIKLSETKIDENNMKEIENQIPYIDSIEGTIDNNIIDKRYKIVNKGDLTYSEFKSSGYETDEIEIHYVDSIKKDASYKDILVGFTYASETNPTIVSYNEALKLIKKVLPDDIEQVDTILDKEVSKEYIYYQSEKGNFRIGLSYGNDFEVKSIEEIHEDVIVGIDYSKEIR